MTLSNRLMKVSLSVSVSVSVCVSMSHSLCLCCAAIMALQVLKGLSLTDIVTHVAALVHRLTVPAQHKMLLYDKLSDIECVPFIVIHYSRTRAYTYIHTYTHTHADIVSHSGPTRSCS